MVECSLRRRGAPVLTVFVGARRRSATRNRARGTKLPAEDRKVPEVGPMQTIAFPPSLLAIGLGLLAGGCWYPKERGESLEQRIGRVEGAGPSGASGDRATADERAQQVDARIAELEKKVVALSSAPRTASEGAGREDPAARAEREKLAAELSRQRAQLDASARRLEGIEKALAQLQAHPPERAAERRPAAARTPEPRSRSAEPAPTAPPAAAAPQARAPETPGDKEGFLAFAREQEAKGQASVARDLYEQYVASFPTDPTAAEAHFRLGELAFRERRYQDAIGAYGQVARGFPRSGQAPDAMLKTAESMLRLDLKDEATAVLSEIPSRYPSSAAATRAQQRLAELGKGDAGATRK
jgi:tol-pal system protein YbgF